MGPIPKTNFCEIRNVEKTLKLTILCYNTLWAHFYYHCKAHLYVARMTTQRSLHSWTFHSCDRCNNMTSPDKNDVNVAWRHIYTIDKKCVLSQGEHSFSCTTTTFLRVLERFPQLSTVHNYRHLYIYCPWYRERNFFFFGGGGFFWFFITSNYIFLTLL